MSVALAVASGVTALFAFLFVGVELALHEQRVGYLGATGKKPEAAAPDVPATADSHAYLRIPTDHLAQVETRDISVSDAMSVEKRVSLDLLDTLEKSGHRAVRTQPSIPQARRVRVAYSKRKYAGQAFTVRVSIGADGLAALSTLDKYSEQAKADILRFKSHDARPRVQVELQFAAGEFNVNRTKITQTLSPDNQSDFDFLVKPLKAEDCILSVVISYLSDQRIPEHPTRRTDSARDVTDAAGSPTSHEEGVETVITLATTATQVTPVWTADLIVSVNQIFGMNASTVGALRAALGVVAAVVAVVVALNAKNLDAGSATAVIVMAVVDAFGAPSVDVAKTLLASKQV